MYWNLFFVGTLHAGLTPNKELEAIIKEINPDRILVEILQEDIEKVQVGSYPPEMVFAYKFARNNKIRVLGFDSKVDIFQDSVTKADDQELLLQQKRIIGNKSWKLFNKSENAKLLTEVDQISDMNRWRKREKEMARNIRKVVFENKKVLVITGCGHLDYFEQEFPNAVFPLR